MTSERKKRSNKINSEKSTGPKPESWLVTSQNAVKDGLFRRHLLIREEERPMFTRFSERLRADLQPLGPTEDLLIADVVSACWRLRVCLKMEKEAFEFYRVYDDVKGDAGMAFAYDASQVDSLTRLGGYAAMFERRIHKGLAELRKVQARRGRQTPQAPGTADTSTKGSTAAPSAPAGSDPINVLSGCVESFGIFSDKVVLADEDPAEFQSQLQSLSAEWKAREATKALFIELLAVASWRLARLSRVEIELLAQYGFDGKADKKLLRAFVRDAAEIDCISKLGAHETRLRNSLSKILKELLAS